MIVKRGLKSGLGYEEHHSGRAERRISMRV